MLAYTKPKIVLLDDDRSLLDVVHYYLNEKFQAEVKVEAFSKSYDFISYIEENCYLPETPTEILGSFYANPINKTEIIKTLKDLSVLPGILVLDQELRGEDVTGIDLSATIREYFPTSFICMLTSNVPDHTAIKLHNNHNIDLFVDKKDTDAIHNLYLYLSKHIDSLKMKYPIDPIDIFGKTGNLESSLYIQNRKTLLENSNPLCFLTLNENGDMAIMQDNYSITFWQYNPTTSQFIAYEY
ncbi:hypothetical protein ACFORL_08195 [Legionella dresdenensis]|uniref:Response regulatory domain-containing protein n=1 Tax=Legionella dresdenensis TaxID=450200 RepID=A0ABV8CGG0_9GAMM